MFDNLIAEYKKLEPEGVDSWNPLGNEKELWHRIRLFIAFDWALQQIPVPITKLKVLDVGCGVGRSTRTLVEFGVKPENILGIDLRSSAIECARSLNPAIPFRVVESFDDWPLEASFHLCVQSTVFSSIKGNDLRLSLAKMMENMVINDGYIFWWDRILANDFAGRDLLDPSLLFRNSTLINKISVSLKPSIAESLKNRRCFVMMLLPRVQKILGYSSTHTMAILKKKSIAQR